jgi:hypothetical protein
MIFLILFLFAKPVSADILAENQARFGVVAGDVGLLSQGATDWIEPHEGLPIEPGDHIRTGEDGQVEVIAGENELWMLDPNSEIVAEHVETNAGRFNFESGVLLGKVDSGRTAGTPQHWEFNTPAAVIGIRGTEFAIVFSKTEGTRLGVLEGKVDMEPAETAEGIQAPIEVIAGQEALARRGKRIATFARFSPVMQKLAKKEGALRRRLQQVQNTWSPLTPETRADARKKFVAAPPKPHRAPPRPGRTRRATPAT